MRPTRILSPVPVVLFCVAMLSSSVVSAQTVTEIIDATGDGAGNMLASPNGIAVDGSGNVFVNAAAKSPSSAGSKPRGDRDIPTTPGS